VAKGMQQAIAELTKNFHEQTSHLSAISVLVTNSVAYSSEMHICEEALKVLLKFEDIYKGAIYLLKGDTLHLVARKTLDDLLNNEKPAVDQETAQTLKMGEGITGIVAQTGEQIFVSDHYLKAENFPDTKVKNSLTPFFSTPIIHQNNVVGVLNTFSHCPEENKETQRRFLPIFCGVLAGLLVNANTIDSMQNNIHRQQNDLDIALAKAIEESEAKTSFLLGMSHDLRSPLNAISGFTQLLEIDASMANESKKHVNQISQAGKHLLDLIDHILDLAGIDAGHTDVSKESTNCNDIISLCTNILIGQMEQNGHALVNNIEPDQLPLVYVDPTRMKQVLINLLSNAIKYNCPNGSITLTSCVSKTHVTLYVADQGKGIAADKMAELFMPFNRLGMETSNIQGTGLGLALSKKLVTLMDGEIGVDTTENQGCRFWFSVPILV